MQCRNGIFPLTTTSLAQETPNHSSKTSKTVRRVTSDGSPYRSCHASFICLSSCIHHFLNSQELTLSENKIQEVPESLAHLKALRILRLQNNRLKTLPHELGAVITLEELDCAGNADLDVVPVPLHSDTAMILWVCRLHKGMVRRGARCSCKCRASVFFWRVGVR